MTTLTKKLIAFNTIVTKEVRRIFRAWMQNLLPSAITTTLYFLIFGKLIGPRIGEVHGFSYIDYIAPGLIIMNVITNSYTNTSSSLFLAKFQRSIEEMLIAPMPNYLIIAGLTCGGIARGLIIAFIVGIITLFFTHLQILHILMTLIIIILASMLFSLAGVVNGVFAKTFDDIVLIPTFVLTPLTYLGGVFYSVSMLPPLWQHLSMANPILYIVDAFRYSILGITDINIYFAIGMIVLCNIALFLFALYLMKKGSGLRT